MNKVQWLSTAVIGLLLVNLVVVSTILLKKPAHPFPGPGENMRLNPKEYIIEKLGFDEKQKAAYEAAVLIHRRNINEKEERVIELKNSLYATLLPGKPGAAKDSIERELQLVQKEMEDIHYNHFLEIKAICRPGQIALYNELSKEFASFFTPPKRPPFPPGR